MLNIIRKKKILDCYTLRRTPNFVIISISHSFSRQYNCFKQDVTSYLYCFCPIVSSYIKTQTRGIVLRHRNKKRHHIPAALAKRSQPFKALTIKS